MLTGKTTLIAHLGYPTETFKAPMIYNPWFERRGIDAIVVPMGVKAQDYAVALDALSRFTNLRGALVTMPHKNATLALVAQATPAARIAGACNALLRLPDGTWLGDQFDGAGFVHGIQRKGRSIEGARVLIAGSGGVGSAIAASMAQAGAVQISLFDAHAASAEALRDRLLAHYQHGPPARRDQGGRELGPAHQRDHVRVRAQGGAVRAGREHPRRRPATGGGDRHAV